MDIDSATHFLVEIADASLIFRVGFHIYIFAYEICDICYEFRFTFFRLHKYLGGYILRAARHHSFLVLGCNRHLIGNKIHFA